MNYYEHHIGDWAQATAHLSMLEDAAYSRMLRWYYAEEKPLPADLRSVCRIVRAATEDERAAVSVVLEEFFRLTPDGYRQNRADEEIARYLDKRSKAKSAAQISVDSRKQKATTTNAELRALRIVAAKGKGTHTPAEWAALKQVCGECCVRCGEKGTLQADHIKPVYQGGSDAIENIQPLCPRCNRSKGPEDIDHRPNGWKAGVERLLSDGCQTKQQTLNERSADVKPTSHQSPDTSVTTVTGAAAPPTDMGIPTSPPGDPVKALFDSGIALLVEAGASEKQARGLVGKWRQASGEVEVMAALTRCRELRITDPIPWLTAALTPRAQRPQSALHLPATVDYDAPL